MLLYTEMFTKLQCCGAGPIFTGSCSGSGYQLRLRITKMWNTSFKQKMQFWKLNNFDFLKVYRYLFFPFNLCKNCRYFATTVPLSHTPAAGSRSFFTGSSSSKIVRLHNTKSKREGTSPVVKQIWIICCIFFYAIVYKGSLSFKTVLKLFQSYILVDIVLSASLGSKKPIFWNFRFGSKRPSRWPLKVPWNWNTYMGSSTNLEASKTRQLNWKLRCSLSNYRQIACAFTNNKTAPELFTVYRYLRYVPYHFGICKS